MSAAPLSPSLKDLPKVAVDLKSQLEGFNPDNMKRASTTEKNVLPTAEGGHPLKLNYYHLII